MVSTTSIGSTVRDARIKRGWSQQQLAEAARVSQTTVDKIENGITKKSRFLPEIFKALGLDLADVVLHGGSEESSLRSLDPSRNIMRKRSVRAFSQKSDLIKVFFPQYVDNKGVFNIDFSKWDKVPRPRILDNDRDACAICVTHHYLAPELEIGDIAFFHSQLPVQVGITAMFFDAAKPEGSRVIGRLLESEGKVRIVRAGGWHGSLRLALDEYPDACRLMARYVRAIF